MEIIRAFRQSDAADRFGKLVVENVRNHPLDFAATLLMGTCRAEDLQPIRRQLAVITPEQKLAISEVVAQALEVAMHDLLHALQTTHDLDEGIAAMVDGLNIADENQMLHGDLLGEGGWVD